ncbi:MAG TPA: S8 family serine peptidase, partial [Gaiellaceae bacterium]|nr:S8 family serine peptidase [Gaiellaceae bacterium]
IARLDTQVVTTVTLGEVASVPNAARSSVAGFSSAGLAFDGAVKPELVAPGIGLATSDPGTNADGSPRFVTVNGTSAAAATVAGAAALVAQARPVLAADALKGALVGSAQASVNGPLSARGAGLVAPGAAAAEEVAASPATLALGRSTGAGWTVDAAFTLTNLSTRRVLVGIGIGTRDEGAARVDFTIRPRSASLAPGKSVLVHVRALTASAPVGTAAADGDVIASVYGGGELRVPWAIAFASDSVDLIAAATLSDTTFTPSDETPTLLSLDAGRVLIAPGHVQIRPVRRLDVVLSTASGSALGLLVRLRDLLPGRYTLGITGRGPNGKRLAPGSYVLTRRAYPVGQGPPTVRTLRFSLR